MRIQHNIMITNAYRNYTNNVAAMKNNLEKLSSGYKINRAGDDVAGLAISEKMRAQITGLQTAQKNAKDGISLVQTAEGALTEVHDMLNRMVELATQSANGTYDDETDRYQLQKEMDQLKSEINRIADSSNFNGIKLLDGSMDTSSVSGAKYEDVSAKNIQDKLFVNDDKGWDGVDEDDVIGNGNVLETEAVAKSSAGFEINMDNTIGNLKAGDTFTLKIGDKKIEFKNDTDKTLTSSQLASELAKQNGGKFTIKDDQGTDREFSVKADGKKLRFDIESDENFTLRKIGDVSWTAGPGEEEPAKEATKAKLETAVDLTKAGTPTNNDTIKFTAKGLDVTFEYDGSKWDVDSSASNTVPTGYTPTFDGSKLTIEADKAEDVKENPFGDITVAAATIGGAPSSETKVTVDNANATWTPGVAGKEDPKDPENPPAEGKVEGSVATAASVGGTAAVNSYTLTGKGESDVGTKAIDGVTITWNQDLDTTMKDFVETYNGTTGKDYTAAWDTASNKLTLTANTKAATTYDTPPTSTVQGVTGANDTPDAAAAATLDATDLKKDAIQTAINAMDDPAAGDITIEMNSSNELELKLGGTVIGTSDKTVNGSNKVFAFTTEDGKDLGSVELSLGIADTAFTGKVETGLKYTAPKSVDETSLISFQAEEGEEEEATGAPAGLTVGVALPDGTEPEENDSIVFGGSNSLTLTFNYNSDNEWELDTTGNATSLPEGYEASFDGTSLTITATANGKVDTNPFGTITVSSATLAGSTVADTSTITLTQDSDSWTTGADDPVDVGRQIEAERNGIIKNEEKWGRNGTNKKAAQITRKRGKMWAKNVVGCRVWQSMKRRSVGLEGIK